MIPKLATLRKHCVLWGILLAFLSDHAFAQAPNGFRYVLTEHDPATVLYDNFHQQFFVTIPGSNEVDVISASNLSILSKINVASPYGLDLSADGSRLYVTSNSSTFGYPSAEGFFIIDTTSLKIIDFVQPTVPPNPFQIFFPNTYTVPRFIAAMNNGKIFYNADQRGITSSAIFAYDPATGISTPRPPTGGGNFYDGSIIKSANGTRFVVLSGDSNGGDLWTYDSAADSYIAHLRIDNKVVEDAIISPDGTRVLVAGHFLLDQNLNPITDLNPTAGFQNYRGSAFSPDGTKIYVANSYDLTVTSGGGSISYSNPVVAVYLVASGSFLGYIPAPQFFTFPFNRGIAVSPLAFGILLNDRGFAEMDFSHPNGNLPGAFYQVLRYPNVMTPPVGNSVSPVLTALNGAGFRLGANVYFGSTPALNPTFVSGNQLNVQPPPGSPGPVDVSVVFPDGWTIYGPEAYSYGPSVLYQDVNAGDRNGGTTVQLIGYGFDTPNGRPQVTVGGAPATVTNLRLSSGISPFTFPIEYLTFTTPFGATGFSDISVTTNTGSTTIKNGFQYITYRQIPGVLPAQMLLDESRGRLYVADVNTGKVLSVDTTSLAVSTLIDTAFNPSTGLAMTPDGSKLLVISENTSTLTVFDLTSGSALKTFIPVPGNQPTPFVLTSVVATSRGTALVGLNDPASFDGGAFYEVDLASGAATSGGLGGCPASNLLFAPTSDGTKIYITSAVDGCFSLWSAASDSLVEQRSVVDSVGQLSTTYSGDRFATTSSIYSPTLVLTTTNAPNDLLVSQRSLVRGEKIHSTGSLTYAPTTKGIEIYDTHHGQLVMSLGIPGGAASTLDGLVINRTGTLMYVAEATGVGVLQLSAAPLSIASLSPAQGSSSGGSTVTVLGSGFSNGDTLSLDGHPAMPQIVDSTELTFVTPPTSAAKVAISVSKPSGDTYVLDAAFDASTHTAAPAPTLAGMNPTTTQPKGGGVDLDISGSGFVASSQVLLNGQPVQTLYLSGQRIVAYIYNVQGPGQQAITVMNPPPGGGVSNALQLQVQDVNPVIASLNPPSIPAGSAAFQLTVVGNGTFGPDSVVYWNGSQRPTLFVAPGELIAQISASDIATIGTANVTVNAPSAPSPLSNTVQFTILAPAPAASIQPLNLAFATQLVGTSSVTAVVTLNSTGQLPLVITSISLTDPTNFIQANTCPTSVSPGQSCVIRVTFAPPASAPLGPITAKLSIVDNSSTSPEVVNLTASAADFQLKAGASTLNVSAGHSVADLLTMTSLGGALSDNVQLSCSGLPTGTVCAFSPVSVIPTVSGSTVNLIISTTGPGTALLSERTQILWAGLPWLALLGLAANRRGKRITLSLLLLVVGIAACGGGSISTPSPSTNPAQTPSGSYTITVTATDGTVQRTTTIGLTVSPS